MSIAGLFGRRGIVLTILAIAVVTAVTYGVVTYQTPYGCGPDGVATGPGVDWQVLAKPCIYIYFTGIVGGSVLLILLIPTPEKKSGLPTSKERSAQFFGDNVWSSARYLRHDMLAFTSNGNLPGKTYKVTIIESNEENSMKRAITTITIALILTLAVPVAAHGTKTTSLNFTNIPLLRPDGNSEPELSIGPDGTTVYVALSWTQFFTNTWKAGFGQVPQFQGTIDANLANNVGGGGDADVDIGSTGTLHVSTLIFFFNPQTRITQLGVSAITCPNADTSNNFSHCTSQIIDSTQSDRQWITSDGPHVYISYHDSGSSTLIHVQRSDDDGFTFHRVTDPITGQGGATGNSTFNNDQGKLIADSFSHNVYTVWASGVSGLQKGTTANFNNIYVTVSPDMGKTWTPHLVFSGPINVALNNVFPALAVDPLSGTLYAGWSDAHHVFISKSTDQGNTWTSPLAVNTTPANTAIFPWIAARGSTVDYVYYGTNTSSKDDPRAVWNVYMAQSSDSGSHFAQSTVTARPNHVGVICTNGTGCARGTRNLLDLFQDAIDPLNGLAAIIYTDDTSTTQADGSPLPQVSVAFQTA